MRWSHLFVLFALTACGLAPPTTAPPEPGSAVPTSTANSSAQPTPNKLASAQAPFPSVIAPPTPDLSVTRPGTVWNFELVGHHTMESIGWHAGLALKDHCAYVANRGSPIINILDIAVPSHPSQIGFIPFAPGSQPVELRALPDLNLLVVADLAASINLLTFDISDCARPEPLGSIALERSPHEFFLWRKGTQVLAYLATFQAAPPDLLVVDLTDPAKPVEITRWSAADEGAPGVLHSISLTPDGLTAFLAMTEGGFLVADLDLPAIRLRRDSKGKFAAAEFPGAHSAVALQDPRFVLLTSELYSCPFGGLAVADISVPARPVVVSRFSLPENRCEDLPQPDAVFTAHNPLVVGDLVFVTWYAGGLQALDLSDPYTPRRVGEFVPAGEGAAPRSYIGTYPVQTWSYPILRDRLLYVVDIQSGLYVLRYFGPGAEILAAVPLAEANVISER